MPHLRNHPRGISLIEVVLFGSLAAGLFLWLSPWLAKPTRIQQKLLAALDERKVLRATDTLVNDLKQMIPGSLSLDPFANQAPLAFYIAGDPTPAGDLPGTPAMVHYLYQPAKTGANGSLYRIVNGSFTVILTDLLAPEPTSPLFYNDPTLRILTVDFRLKQPKGPAQRVVRRVALPN